MQRRLRKSAAALAVVLCSALLAPGCGGGGPKRAKPRPPAAKAPVTTGELVQLRLAVEGLDAIFDARAEEQDLLPALVHAWATFYHWTDPAPTAKARYAFTEKLCRARIATLGPRTDLFTCMDHLRESLYADLLEVSEAYIRAGHPDKIGEYRLRRLRAEFRLRKKQFMATRKLLRDRRAARLLPTVAACELEPPLVPVVGVTRKNLSLNGFPVLSAPGGLSDLQAADLDGFRQQLENRLGERPAIRRAAQQLVLAADRRVDSRSLLRLLRTISALGVTRICVKVMRSGRFQVPCCLPLRVTPRLVALQRWVELSAKGALRANGAHRTALPTAAAAWPAARATLAEPTGTAIAIQLRPGLTTGQVVTWIARLGGTGLPPEIVLNKAAHPPAPPLQKPRGTP